jgi:tetratricopeptide (TPR) repeat protein
MDRTAMHTSLLETLGRGLAVDCAALLTEWLNEYGYTLADPADASYQVWLDAVVNDLVAGRWTMAEQRIRPHLAADGQSVAAHIALAAVCLHQDQVSQARESLDQVCSRRPDHTLALYALGHCSERLHEENRAIACYQDCLKLRGFLHLPMQRLGAIYTKNLQYESAIEQYTSLSQIDPEAMPIHMTLGHLYAATGQHSHAIEAFGNAILMNADALVGPDPQIDQLVHTEDFDQAILLIEGQLEQFPQKADLLSRRADILTLMGLNDEALEDYKQALRQCPTYLEAAVKLATHCSNVDALDEAARYFLQAQDINDQIIDAYMGLAMSYSQSGALQNALAALCSASMLQPNASLWMVQASRMLLKVADPCSNDASEDPGHSAATLERLFEGRVQAHPEDPASHYAAAILALHRPDAATAANHLNHALKLHSTYPRASSKLTLAGYAMGDNQTALDGLTAKPHAGHAEPAAELYYQTCLLYCSRPRFAASMINLMQGLNRDMATMDPSPHIRIVLENLGLLDRPEMMLAWLQETILPAMASQG